MNKKLIVIAAVTVAAGVVQGTCLLWLRSRARAAHAEVRKAERNYLNYHRDLKATRGGECACCRGTSTALTRTPEGITICADRKLCREAMIMTNMLGD
jgi:hypothetical protein